MRNRLAPALLLAAALLTGPVRAAEPSDLDFVDVAAAVPGVRVALPYAIADNFLRRQVYPSGRCFLRRGTAAKLARAQAALAAEGFGLKVLDGYRPLSVQRQMWQIKPDPRYVADPAHGSRHNRGAAVDVTLVTREGDPLEMPTSFDDFSGRAAAFSSQASPAALRNRRLLQQEMERASFQILASEWWHFDDSSWSRYPIEDVSVEELASRPPAEPAPSPAVAPSAARRLVAVSLPAANPALALARRACIAAFEATPPITFAGERFEARRKIAVVQIAAGDFSAARATADMISDLVLASSTLGDLAAAQAKAGDGRAARETAAAIREEAPRAGALAAIAAAEPRRKGAPVPPKRLAEAMVVANSTPAGEGRFAALVAIASALAGAGDAAGARSTFVQARKAVPSDTESLPAPFLLDLMRAQAKAKDIAGAMATTVLIKDDALFITAHRLLVQAQAANGDFAGAKATAKFAQGIVRADALALVAAIQARSRDHVGARATLAAARAALDAALREARSARAPSAPPRAPGMPDVQSRVQAFLDKRMEFYAGALFAVFWGDAELFIAKAQARLGDLDAAAKTAAELAEEPQEAVAWCEVAVGRARAGDKAGAEAAFNRARDAANKLRDDGPRAYARRTLAEKQAKAGDLNAAKATAQELDGIQRASARRTIAIAQAWQAGTAETEEWVRGLSPSLDRSYAWLGLAEAALAQAQGRAAPEVEEDSE